MTATLNAGEVERFRAAIATRLGLQFEESKLGFLGEVLRRRLVGLASGSESYLRELEQRARPEELGALARELTVAETYFFRHMDQFRAFSELALPERLRARSVHGSLRILSAGCASGEEAYSLAILALDALASSGCDLSIRGVDVNPAMPEKAARAHYSPWALRETPPELQRAWFRREGQAFLLEEAARRLVTFQTGNLLDEDDGLWPRESYDVVFCRNVIMYLTPEAARTVVERITRALAPGGFLFLGHAETLRALSQDFHLRHTHGTFYYQRKAGIELDPPAPFAFAAPGNIEPLPTTAVANAEAWVNTIRKAHERIQALVPARATASRKGWDLGQALDLLNKERFAEALGQVRSLPLEAARDLDVMLLEAALLVHSGELAAAERSCQRMLAVDELSAGAHYLLALCREGCGDAHGAAEHDRVAVYLDSTFAMPRLHLGLLARRAKNDESARRELAQALLLLQREEASRLLLFGGGFQREALIALCRTELCACGENR